MCWRVQRTIERLRPKKSGKGGVVGAVGVYTLYYSPSLFFDVWLFAEVHQHAGGSIYRYIVYRVNTVGDVSGMMNQLCENLCILYIYVIVRRVYLSI